MRIRATLKDFYVGRHITLTRVKGTYEKTSGTRQCNCRMKTVTKQLGPGMIQQFQQRVRVHVDLHSLSILRNPEGLRQLSNPFQTVSMLTRSLLRGKATDMSRCAGV